MDSQRDLRGAAPSRAVIEDKPPAGLSVVIPCYNSVATLEPLTEELLEVLPSCAERYEIILVNDDSQDRTWEIISRLSDRHPQVRGINLMRNYGQHNATLCGVRASRYDVSITMDDDLQHPPTEIPKLLDKLGEGHDVVYGAPHKRRQALLRYFASLFTRYAITMATGHRSVRELSAFRAFRTSLRGAFVDYRSPEVLFDALLGWGTTRVASVTVRHDLREVGRSNYGFFRLVNVVMLLWTGYTTAPLRFASLLGFAFVLFGVAVLVYMFGLYFISGTVPGFPFLASTIAIFGGVQLFTLGIIGEYLARVFNRSLDRPTYVVKDTVSRNEWSEPSRLRAETDTARRR
jgi:undecaprenyl-phosphate 4-deoxy-4-formamido-L-arabinose transferase